MPTTDVIVAGGGIIGLAAALRLAEAGLSVVILERGGAGAEASVAGAGLLLAQTETDPGSGHPEGAMQEALLHVSAQARAFHPPFVAKLTELTGREILFRQDGAVSVAVDEEEAARLEARIAWQRELGFKVDVLSERELEALVPGVRARSAAFFPEDGFVDNQTLVRALIDVVRDAGVEVIEHASVTELIVEGGAVVGARTAEGPHHGGTVVLAAGAWTDEILPPGEPRLGMHPVRGQMALLEGDEPAPALPVMAGGFYIAPRVDGPALLGSTVEAVGFDRSTTEQGIAAILDGVARFMPATRRWRIAGSWAGLRPRAADGYPVVGPATAHRNLWVATGHFRSGILWAPLTATWIAEGILTGMLPAEAGPFGIRRFAH